MTIQDIRAQEKRQREIDHVEKIRRTIRSDYEIQDAVPLPPVWARWVLGVVCVGIVLWQGGIVW